jgi:hypothetical protein
MYRTALSVVLVLGCPAPGPTVHAAGADAEGWIDLSAQGREAWQKTKGWSRAESVAADPKNAKRLTFTPGTAILVNGRDGRAPDLISKQKFGDLEVHVEFLIPKQSNSGVKLQGFYEIQIADSQGRARTTGSDCGGIYPRAELRPRYHHIDEGTAPRINACRPAGEWQTLDIVFRAPRFQDGKKSANARFVKVVLNGKVIHENVELQYPTGHAWHNKESATGPLLLQGDHGPVAFRNVRVRAAGK